MKIINFLILVVLILFVFQCSTNNILQNEYTVSDGIIIVETVNTESFKFDRYNLNDMKIVEDSIILNVSFSGGCRKHEFNLIAKNYFGDSVLPKATLLLSHNSNLDPCERYITENYTFNLLPLKYEFIKLFGTDNRSIRMVLDEIEVLYSF